MSDQIIQIKQIIDSARWAVNVGQPITACPFLEGTVHADRWRVAFYAREMELLAEVAT